MSQNETIQFACPSCNTGLTVPANLAGVTGPCPHCQAAITAPHPVPVAPQQVPANPVAQAPAPQDYPQQQAPPVQTYEAQTEAEIPSERPPGQPPHKQAVNTQAEPTPARAAPVDMEPAPRTKHKRRKIWPTLLFPALFLLLAAAVVYLILDLMGILDFGDKTPKEQEPSSITQTTPEPVPTILPPEEEIEATPISETVIAPEEEPISVSPAKLEPLEHDPQDVKKPGEVSTELPDLTKKAPPSDADSVKMRTVAIKEAQEVLKRFLVAQTFEERKPLITKSDRSDEVLAASSLGKRFPKNLEPSILTVRERDGDRSFEVFFSVPFEQTEGDRSRIVLLRTVSYSEEDAPKIHTDPFLDLYEEPIKAFHSEKKEGTGTFSSIVEFSAYCFDDIPKAATMAKVTFYTNIAASAKPIATAYLSKESEPFKQLSKMAKTRKRIPATVSVTWDTESDPKRPFLQVIRIEAINWSL